MKKNRTLKIGTRISAEENRRLEELAIQGGFKSTYALLRYLIFCCLRAFNHSDDNQGGIPPEIVRLFEGSYTADANLISKAISNIQQREQRKNRKHKQRSKKPVDVHEEVSDLFEECEALGEELEWRPDIRKRK